jgi:hypothetical protein
MELSELGLSEEQLNNVKKLIQSEADKVRTDYSTKLKTANDELAKFKPAEKSDVEKALELKQKELADKEKELSEKEKSYKIKEKLSSKGLPSELAKFINVGEDTDATIDEFGTTLNALLLNGNYKPNNHNKSEGITKEDFKKMNYSERAKLLDTNPELYKKLAN